MRTYRCEYNEPNEKNALFFRMHVEVGDTQLELSLDDLKSKYDPVTITTTIQCAGNRRKEMSDYKSVKGLSWGPCAIGTARWTGVR